MAESAVKFLLEKLCIVLTQEASLLKGIHIEVEEIKLELDSMRSFLRDADRRQDSIEGVRNWIRQVRDVAYDVEDIIDEFMYRMRSPRKQGFNGCLLHTIHLPKNIYYRRLLATQMQEIKVKVHNISERRSRYGLSQIEEGTSSYDAGERWQRSVETSLYMEDDDIIGMKKEIASIVGWLVDEDQGLKMISVTGMGGQGKTTLVIKAFKHPQVKKHFNCYACVSMSQTLRVNKLLRSILKQLIENDKEMDPNELSTMDESGLRKEVRRRLEAKKYVVILDDIWSINDWEQISSAFPNPKNGSALMFTTRDVHVARALGGGRFHCVLQPLNQDEAWELFSKKAFRNKPCPPELHPLAQIIAEKCDGLPLAILAMGGLLLTKEENIVEWNNILNSLNWELSHNTRLKTILLLSFYHLPYYLKHCFLYCAIFPEDYVIGRKRLIRLWVAEGFAKERGRMTMEEVAEEYLKELIHRNMLQVTKTNLFGRVRTFRMHDVMRELALSLSSEEEFSMIYDNEQEANQLTKVRHISSCNCREFFQSPKSLSHLRTVIVFDRNMPSSSSSFLHSIVSSFPLLGVLNLEGVPVERLPNELTNLFNLKYLNLRRTEIRELPKSLEKLQNLQTLDVRNTKMESLPSGIVKLKKLRHLFLFQLTDKEYKSFNYFNSLKVPIGICNLTGLQTLRHIEVEHGDQIVRKVGNLTQLRVLGISKVRTSDGEELCTSIRKMKQLHRLCVAAMTEEEPLELGTLSPNALPLLQKLSLLGRLEKVPIWLSSFANLTSLSLYWSQLREEEDPLPLLQASPYLLFLELWQAYKGQLLRFHDGWFPKLKRLTLWELTQLNTLVIDQGALLCIQYLTLIRCGELKMVPQGIENLIGLQEFVLREMPMELVERLRLKEENEEHRQKVGHIPLIRHFFKTEEGQWDSERLD